MDLAGMKRRELQALCKRHGLPAGGTNADLVAALSGAAAGAEEEAAGAPARKGCLKPTGGDAAEAKKVTFAAEERKARRLRSRVIWSPVAPKTRGRKSAQASTDSPAPAAADAEDSISAEVAANVPVRRTRRNSVSVAEAEEVGEAVAVGRKRKSRNQENDKSDAVSAQVGVSSRVTRRSSLAGAAAVLPPPAVEKKRGRGKAAGGSNKLAAEAQDSEPDVQKSAQVEVSARVTRSRATAPVVVSPTLVENKRKRKTGDAGMNVELPMAADVPRNDAPVTRSLRNRVVQFNNSVVDETHTARQLESKMQPSRPPTRRHQQVSSSVEDKNQEQIAAPSKAPLLRRSGRNHSEDVEKQPAVKEPVKRSTRRSVVLATLEKEENGLIEEKKPETPVRRSTRKSVVPVEDIKDIGEEVRNANREVVVKQPATKGPARASRRKSVVSGLHDKEKGLIAEKNMEAPEGRSMRKPAMPVKDIEALGKRVQNAKGKDVEKQFVVKQPTRRSSRKSVLPDIVENSRLLAAEMNAEMNVRRSTRKSVLPNMLNEENQDHSKMARKENFQSGQCQEDERQQKVKEPTRRSRRSVAAVPLEEKMDHTEIVAREPERVGEEGLKLRKHRRSSLEISSSANDCWRKQQNAQIPIEKDNTGGTQHASDSTTSKGKSSKRRRTTAPEDVMSAKEASDDIIVREATKDAHTHEYKESSSRVQEFGQDNATREELSSGPLLVTVTLTDDISTVQSVPVVIPGSESGENANERSDKSKQEHSHIQADATHLSETSGELDQSSCIAGLVPHNCVVSEDKALMSKDSLSIDFTAGDHEAQRRVSGEGRVGLEANASESGEKNLADGMSTGLHAKTLQHDIGVVAEETGKVAEESNRAADLGECPSRRSKENPLSTSLHLEGAADDSSLPVLHADGRPSSFDLELMFDEECNCQGVAEEEVLAEEKSNDQHVSAKTDHMKLNDELAGPGTESGCCITEKNATLVPDDLDQQAIIQVQHGDVQEGDLKKPPPCSATPECKHKCDLPEETVLPRMNTGSLSSAEQSPFGLKSLFSEENIDESMGSATAPTKNGFGDSIDCHITSVLENTLVSEPFSHDDTEEDGLSVDFTVGDHDEQTPVSGDGRVGLEANAIESGEKNRSIDIVAEETGKDVMPLASTIEGHRENDGENELTRCDTDKKFDVDQRVAEEENTAVETPVTPSFYVVCDCLEDEDVQPTGRNADVDQGVTEEVLAKEECKDQHVPAKTDLKMKINVELASPVMESGCSITERNGRLVADILNQQAAIQVQQSDVQEGDIEKPSLCLATPERKHECDLPEETVLPSRNTGSLPSAEQSSFGLESLFSQESIDTSVGYGALAAATAHTENGFDDSKGCHVKSALENTHVLEPFSHHDTEGDISKNDDCMHTPQQDHRMTGKANLDEERVLSIYLLDAKNIKEVINSEQVACEGEGSKKLVQSEELKASSEKRDVNGPDGNSYGITDTVLSSALHTPANDNYEICLDSNTDVLHQGSDTPGYKHEGALSEEAVRTMKNYAGTCSSNPRELLMELQSLFSKGNIKESDPHDGLAFPNAENSGDESINVEQQVKVQHGSDLSHLGSTDLLDEQIGCSNTEVLLQGLNHKDRSNVNMAQQVASEPCTNDIVEVAAAAKCVESGLVLLPSEDRSNLNDGQLNPKLESPNIMGSGLNCDKDVCNTSDNGSVVSGGERTPSGSGLPGDYPKDHYPRQELLDGVSVESSLQGTIFGKKIVSGVAGNGNPSSLATPDYKYVGALSTEAVCRMTNYTGTCLADPKHLLMDLQSPYSEGSAEKSDMQDNLVAFPSAESRKAELFVCHVEKLVDTHVSSEPDAYQGPCHDLNRHEEKESCMSVPMQVKEGGGSLRSSHMKGSLTSVPIDLADDSHLIERDIVAAVEVLCEETVERKSMPTSDSDFLQEKSYSNGNGICQSRSEKHNEANSMLSSCGTEVLHQHHKEECDEPNEGKFSPKALVENSMIEDAPIEGMESSIMLPLVAGMMEIPNEQLNSNMSDESEELSFSCDKDAIENFCTGPPKRDLSPLAKDFHKDSCQKQEVPGDLSLPKSPEESAKFECASVSGSGPCQQRSNKSTSMRLIYNIETLNQDNEEYNQNNEDQTTPGIPASSVPEAVEIEQSEMEIGLIPAAETPVLLVPDEQLNNKLEGNEVDEHSSSYDKDRSSLSDTEFLNREASNLHEGDHMDLPSEDNHPNDLPAPRSPEQPAYVQNNNEGETTPGIPASSVPKAVEIEQSEMEIGLPAAETPVLPVPDEQLNNKLEGNEVDEGSSLSDTEFLNREASNLHEEYCMDLPSEDNHPNDLPAPRSPEQPAYVQNNNDDQTTPGIPASSVPEAVEIEQSEMEIGLIPAAETQVLPVPDEQLNNKLEGNEVDEGSSLSDTEFLNREASNLHEDYCMDLPSEDNHPNDLSAPRSPGQPAYVQNNNEDQTTPGIPASSVPEVVEIEQSEMEIGLIPSAETPVLPVPDEQLNNKLEGNEVDEHSCSYDKDSSSLSDTEFLNREAFNLHEDDCMDLPSEDNHPNDLSASRSPEQPAYVQNNNDSGSVGSCQSSSQRGIGELRAKLQSFKLSSTVKGSYIAMSAPRPKPGDSMSQSAIALLRNIENTPAGKAGHPVKPNADGKDSSRRALQPISGRPREH